MCTFTFVLFYLQVAEHFGAKFFEASSLTGDNCEKVSFHVADSRVSYMNTYVH